MLSYERELLAAVKRDPRTMVLTAENRAPMRNIVKELGDHFLDTGITEQAMIGIAAGLALRGRRPVCHALAPFLTMRAFEFIRTDVGLPRLPVKIVGFIPGILSDGNGPTHQALEDISLMRGIPHMEVFCPADEAELADALPHILASDNPSYIRWHQTPAVLTHEPFSIGKAETVKEGGDLHILTYGYLFRECLKATEILAAKGIKAGLTNLRTLSPVDEESVARAASSSRLVVTVEDHFRTGGLSTVLAEVCLKRRLAPIHQSIAFDEWFSAGRLGDVMKKYGLDGESLAARIETRFQEVARA